MRTPEVFAMILLGTAATATAQPKQEETSGRVSINDSPADARRNEPRAPGDWVELASATPARHGTEYITVGKDAGGFGKLRIDAAKGAIPVKQVRVTFCDGKTKAYRLNKLARPQASLFVDLPATKAIDSVVIVTDARARGEYALYGSGTGGVIANR